ncbi:hypothetical protein [Sphingopyxis sp. RIFCSPHIGHO2_12_FULL_65_19]|uniref:hypothetical protein n=1 Tax=Sphingopyxis sp. RIFCSPHIGHO2_12_FULL_65_19 TaxID=1802172 RepID=UPI0025E24D2E|nr:hypothetical protein [Sphingopyxis sp. RIFCSPHIGHO2_12_FULL_65_19]
MSSCYVRLDDVPDEKLEFLGYILVEEDEYTKVYYHLGDYVIVDKSDPFMFIHDHNDTALLGSEAISLPTHD